MLRYAFLILSLIVTVLLSETAQAHHTTASSGASSGTRTFLFQGRPAKPASRLFSAYDVLCLDQSIGTIHTITWGGEYSITRRLSVLGMIPLVHLNQQSRSSATGLGDVALQGKFLLWDKPKTFSYLTSLWSFPTGSESKALGRGAVGQEVDGFWAYRLQNWLLFVSTGFNYGYESSAEPLWLASGGISSPRFLKDRLSATLTASSLTFLSSDDFKSGTAKAYLEPGLNVFLDRQDHWSLSLTGKFSIIDTLERKPGVVITSTSRSLLNDGLWGTSLSLNFQFD